jgi:hypothetical protein
VSFAKFDGCRKIVALYKELFDFAAAVWVIVTLIASAGIRIVRKRKKIYRRSSLEGGLLIKDFHSF